ncbi:MAG: S4 domain-containing protein, partial [bacterium]
MAERERADILLVSRGLAESRQKAQALILAGQVFSGERRIDKAGDRLPLDTALRVKTTIAYVSRGGLKLEAALDRFGVDPAGKSCIDVGAS